MTDQSPYLTYLRQHGRDCVPDPAVPDTNALLDGAFGHPPTGPARRMKVRTQEALAFFGAAANLREATLLGATRPDLPRTPAPIVVPTGANTTCVTAIMDDAVPFAEPGLGSRLVSLWAQSAQPTAQTPDWLPFGRDVRGPALEQAMATASSTTAGPRGTCQPWVRPGRDAVHRLYAESGAGHGAAVLGQLTGQFGEAPPPTPLVAVQFPPEVTRDTSGALLPYFAICGLLHIMEVTRKLGVLVGQPLPMVVNFSFGVLAGAKDGSGVFEDLINDLAGSKLELEGLGPILLVVPTGNGRQSQSHAVLGGSGATDVGFRIIPDDRTASFMEIHPTSDVWPDVTVTPPGGTPVTIQGSAVPDQGVPFAPGAFAYRDDSRFLPCILLAFDPTAPGKDGESTAKAGVWTISVPAGSGEVRLFLQRDDPLDGLSSGGRQAYFIDSGYRNYEINGRPIDFDPEVPASPIRRVGTANAYAAGRQLWTVGSTIEYPTRSPIAPYSGQALDGEFGDKMAATDRSPVVPGTQVRTYDGTALWRQDGTSLAAPQVGLALVQAIASGVDPRQRLVLSNTIGYAPPAP